jgi:hypothetical protein
MPAYKGAWRGHHDGTRADTIWSPRLSPMRVLQGNPPWACLRIRHELLRPVSAMGFQQLGCPVGNPPYHPDGPPWLAGLGLRHWYTYLVYPQHLRRVRARRVMPSNSGKLPYLPPPQFLNFCSTFMRNRGF